jgi:hypothetical protein
MSALTLTPKSWASWDFTVSDGSRPIADIDVSWWREKGLLTVQGVAHRVYREGAMSGDFILERDGTTLARASKPSAFRQAFELDCAGRQYTLRKKSAWSRTFVLIEGERIMGAITPNSMWTRGELARYRVGSWELSVRIRNCRVGFEHVRAGNDVADRWSRCRSHHQEQHNPKDRARSTER